MNKVKWVLLFCLLFSVGSYAQEDLETFDENTIPVLNEEFRKIRKDLEEIGKVSTDSSDTAGYLDTKVDDTTIEVSSNALQVKAGGIGASHVADTFGAWDTATYSQGTQYTASTDGIVCATSSDVLTSPLIGLTGTGTPPANQVQYNGTGGDPDGVQGSITFPVRSGEDWKVTGQAGTVTIFWMPVGS